jgi:sugar phosphate isomerase/epimerase
MNKKFNRRKFTKFGAMAGAAVLAFPGIASAGNSSITRGQKGKGNLRIGLNAFSFDKPLRAGTMTIDDLLEFCARTGFESVDLTGYYFPGYPAVPSDEYIFHVRRKAFRLGIDLGCTGVRNDFTWADPIRRVEEKKLVRDWIVVAEKLGAPGVRIFAGTLSKEEYPREVRAKWIAEDINDCADFGRQHGVMIALQNHNDFLKTADDVVRLLKIIDHSWVGLMLDIGSYHTPDPYSDIEATAGYAISWQMKEKIFINETQVDTDYRKVISIVRQCGYMGSLPLETLGEGDPATKVAALYDKVLSALES